MPTPIELEKIASQVRRDIVRMVHAVNSGHPGGSLGCTDYLVALYFEIMKHTPQPFDMDGKKVTGLSWLGVQEASRALGGIDIEIMERKEGEAKTESLDWKWIEFVVKAKDVNTDSARLGIKRQYNKGRRRDGKIYDIPFYTEIALSKAQRNAIRSLLPQTLIKAWIQTHRKGATEKDIQAGQKVIQETRAQIARYNCAECNGAITPAVADYSIRNYGKEMCMSCQSNNRGQLN